MVWSVKRKRPTHAARVARARVQILPAGGRAQINAQSRASTPARQDPGLITSGLPTAAAEVERNEVCR